MKSFIEVDQESDFPIQNLPYGVFTTETQSTKHIGVAIGEYVLDITLLEAKGFLTEALNGAQNIFNQGVLNPFLALKNDVWHQVRKTLQSLLSIDNDTIQSDSSLKEEVLIPRSIITNHVPISIGDYTDF
ncbi:fumarylacetoacetase, partial [Staphylococcus felis]